LGKTLLSENVQKEADGIVFAACGKDVEKQPSIKPAGTVGFRSSN